MFEADKKRFHESGQGLYIARRVGKHAVRRRPKIKVVHMLASWIHALLYRELPCGRAQTSTHIIRGALWVNSHGLMLALFMICMLIT